MNIAKVPGRLNHQMVYLCGSIDKCNNFGRQWREELTPFLQRYGMLVLDPKNKPIKCALDSAAGEDDKSVQARHKLIEEERYDELAQGMKPIRNIDLRMVDKADVIIVNYDITVPMCGTMEEFFWGNREKKPIIIRCPEGKKKISPWLFAALKHEIFFQTWDEVRDYLTHIHLAEEIDTLNGRWVFFEQGLLSEPI
jgi:hypothetical protein